MNSPPKNWIEIWWLQFSHTVFYSNQTISDLHIYYVFTCLLNFFLCTPFLHKFLFCERWQQFGNLLCDPWSTLHTGLKRWGGIYMKANADLQERWKIRRRTSVYGGGCERKSRRKKGTGTSRFSPLDSWVIKKIRVNYRVGVLAGLVMEPDILSWES